MRKQKYLFSTPGDPRSAEDYQSRRPLYYSRWSGHSFMDTLSFLPFAPPCRWCSELRWTVQIVGKRKKKPERVPTPHLCTPACEGCGSVSSILEVGLTIEQLAECVSLGKSYPQRDRVCVSCNQIQTKEGIHHE